MAGHVHTLIVVFGALVATCFIAPAACLSIDAGNADSPVKRKPLLHKRPGELTHKATAKQKPISIPLHKANTSVTVNNKSMAANNDKKKTKKKAAWIKEPYRCTVHKQSSDEPKRVLILLGPWNGSTGFFDSWLLEDFHKWEPSAKEEYRILDCVGQKIGVDEWNPYPYNSWYEYEDWASETPVMTDVALAVAFVHSLIEKEAADFPDYSHVVLAGFSQGANLAMEAALQFHSPLGLVFSQRGIILAARKEDETPVSITPYLLTAGEEDHTYTEDIVKENCRWLENMGAPAYMKTISGLDHYRESKKECKLMVKSLAKIASSGERDFSSLTDWTDCHD